MATVATNTPKFVPIGAGLNKPCEGAVDGSSHLIYSHADCTQNAQLYNSIVGDGSDLRCSGRYYNTGSKDSCERIVKHWNTHISTGQPWTCSPGNTGWVGFRSKSCNANVKVRLNTG